MRSTSALALSSLLLTSVLAGCHVSSHKNGNNDNVDIGTPFGSMQVKTNDNVEASGLNITPYPGAQLVKKDKDTGKDTGAADVNMSFGSFHLGVKAVSYTTPDDPDKVLTFYKNDLKRFGDVLQCNDNRPVGEPTRTAEGLTCDYDNHKSAHFQWNSDSHKNTELRAGSKQRQHIVAIEKKDGQTRIGLVALDLPAHMDAKTEKDSD